MWLPYILGAVLVASGSQIVDSFLANRKFSSGLALALYSAVFNIVFIPVVMAIESPSLPPLGLIPVFLLASLLDVVYLIPYYRAMQLADASVVSALFLLTRIFVPMFAFVIVGEHLSAQHYIGFFLIMLAGMALSANFKSVFKFNKVFWLMALSSLLVSLDSVLYKYQLEQVSWSTSMVWGSLFTVPWFLLIVFAARNIRVTMRSSWGAFVRSWHLVLGNEFITFVAMGLSMYAVSLAPISKVSALWGVQPFVILGLAFVFKRFGARGVLEDTSPRSTIHKLLFFFMMLVGVLLIKD